MPDTLRADATPELAGAVSRDALKAIRQTKGYSVEKLSLTCGLATAELVDIESGRDADPAKLKRIASALQLPESVFIISN